MLVWGCFGCFILYFVGYLTYDVFDTLLVFYLYFDFALGLPVDLGVVAIGLFSGGFAALLVALVCFWLHCFDSYVALFLIE